MQKNLFGLTNFSILIIIKDNKIQLDAGEPDKSLGESMPFGSYPVLFFKEFIKMVTIYNPSLKKHDKIESKEVLKDRWSTLSKKVIGILEGSTMESEELLSEETSKKKFNELQFIKRKIANQLKNENSANLKETLLYINEELLKMSENIMSELDSSTMHSRKKLFQFRKEIVEEALKKRQESSKKRTDPIEKNYGLAPIFSSTSPNEKTLVSLRNEHGHIVETRSGYRTVEYSANHGGYLTTFDFKVFVGLQKLWEIKGNKKEFEFHIGELSDIIEGQKDGGTYEIITTSLNKLATTSIIMHDYRSGDVSKPYRTRIHNVIQFADFDLDEKRVFITFNEYLHNGLTAGNIARISLSAYQDLSSKTSKLLYPLIASIIDDTNQLKIDELIATLNLTELPRHKSLDRIKKSLNELVDNEIISGYELVREGRSYKYIFITPSDDILENLDESRQEYILS
ncbi:replication initiation protein [Ammoniphilus resinae]|uniref:Initiator Rep protein WH1 domain-containing protein n=1 Tax=Ammoniphilus resinae TaxID=861532 RepID=A0ABS4GNH5_9BACL|nr:replication initiation protein [Ammoniphilus resinae]MBP1931786.1 hypothetical protein [Ammoniphilus resinae]